MAWAIEKLELSEYDDRNRDLRPTVRQPTWENIEAAIAGLNAGRRSSLCLLAKDGSNMVIGGGKGQYHVSVMYHHGGQYLLSDTAHSAEEIPIVLGGVKTPLPGTYVVDLDRALRAARRFLVDGELEPSLEWQTY